MTTGFSEGRIKWDDEDTKNDNLHTGILPDGTYGKDTVVYFCCRSDGSAKAPIELPMRDPFFLLKHSSKCQAVMGMRIVKTRKTKTCGLVTCLNHWLPKTLNFTSAITPSTDLPRYLRKSKGKIEHIPQWQFFFQGIS